MAPRRGSKDDTPPLVKLCHKVVGILRSIILIVFAPSVHAYFLWSAILYLACGILLLVAKTGISEFFCAVDPRTVWGGLGCVNCRSNLLVCEKDDCYRDAVNITWQAFAKTSDSPNYQDFMEASTDIECNNLVHKRAFNPVEMITAINTAVTEGTSITDGCATFHCKVLKTIIRDTTDLYSTSGVCTDVYGTKKPGVDPALCTCGADFLTSTTMALVANKATIDSICGPWLDLLCTTWADVNISLSWCPRRLDGSHPAELVQQAELAVQAKTKRCVGGSCAAERREVATVRQLQDAAPTPAPTGALNDDKPDWTVGEWSKCNCYQQCIPGVKTRLVQCLAASCKEPEPPTKEDCTCKHCANCSINLRMMVLMIFFLVQAGIALLVFLCFLYMTTVNENDMIKISIASKLVGFVCKQLPPLVRIIIVANFFQLALIVVQTWVPPLLKEVDFTWNDGCFDSKLLRITSIVGSSFWLVQVIMANCAKRFTRKPPWLFVPDRGGWPTPIKQIRMMIRALGP
mmetsp:Transcript_120653/g.257706  ORF Transcript_120653/g.257706 Transcript_120653/m.257706 type:complete len:517 (-) Transcript_120653:288-1838(-)